MNRIRQCYFFSLYGALGGLIASFLHQYLLLDKLSGRLSQANRYFYLGLLGGLIGMTIGFFRIFAFERKNYSTSSVMRLGLLCALLGGIGGFVALPLAEYLHISIGGGFKGRILAWILVGTLVGLAENVAGGAKAWKGLVGGGVGGAVAGWLMEILL